jgi:hypothetical protein
MDAYDRLRLRPGQEVTPSLWNRLLQLLRSSKPQAGPGVFLRRLTKGTTVSFRSRGGHIGQTGMFLLTLGATADKGTAGLQIGRGLIDGVMPMVRTSRGLVAIYDPADPDPDIPPQLTITSSRFKRGVCHIFAKVSTYSTAGFPVRMVEIVAEPEHPVRQPYTAYKLLGWLISPDNNPQAADVVQMCHHSQTFAATNINPVTGIFRAWFIAT